MFYFENTAFTKCYIDDINSCQTKSYCEVNVQVTWWLLLKFLLLHALKVDSVRNGF